jgi:hypothetical protein
MVWTICLCTEFLSEDAAALWASTAVSYLLGSLMSHHCKLGHYQVGTYFSVPVFVNAFFLAWSKCSEVFNQAKNQHQIYSEIW